MPLLFSQARGNGTSAGTAAPPSLCCQSEELDQRDPDQQECDAAEAKPGYLAPGQAKPAVAVHEQRSDLLSGDGETDGRSGADHRNRAEDGDDVRGTSERAKPSPPRHQVPTSGGGADV